MKRLLGILILSALAYLASSEQGVAKMGVGLSFGRSPSIEAEIGRNWSLLNVTGGIQVHTSMDRDKGAIFELKFGHLLQISESWFANPFFGVAHHYNSSDFKNLNITRPLFGLEIGKMFREDVGVYGRFTASGNIRILSFGMRGYF